MNQNSISIVLLAGDFLYNGKLDTIERKKIINECLNFLKNTFFSAYFESKKPYLIAIVPGNHDIERELVNESEISKKFELLNSTLIENEFPQIPIINVPIIEVPSNGNGVLQIYLLNSCIGCGEKRFYPRSICELIEKEETTILQSYEDMDTPLIDENLLMSVFAEIVKKEKSIPVLFAHHNLIPQRTSKVAIYSDLINGGIIKDILLKLNRPIIYLHGHIHQDPIEVITSPQNENSKIICISAPLLYPINGDSSHTFGFNIIQFLFNETGAPLGCDVIMHRTVENEPVKRKRIKFYNPPQTYTELSDIERNYFKIIKNIQSPFYLGKFCEKLKETDIDINIKEIDDFFDKLDILGFVNYNKWELDRREVPYELRIVEGVMP